MRIGHEVPAHRDVDVASSICLPRNRPAPRRGARQLDDRRDIVERFIGVERRGEDARAGGGTEIRHERRPGHTRDLGTNAAIRRSYGRARNGRSSGPTRKEARLRRQSSSLRISVQGPHKRPPCPRGRLDASCRETSNGMTGAAARWRFGKTLGDDRPHRSAFSVVKGLGDLAKNGSIDIERRAHNVWCYCCRHPDGYLLTMSVVAS